MTSEQGDEGGLGGTFWNTFGTDVGGGDHATPLERLLDTPDSRVEELLDEEDIIQEFKACNDKLVSRLSQPNSMKVLMEFVTCEPSPSAPSQRCFRYPFVAVELMTCGPDRFFGAFVQPEGEQALDILWDFLEAMPPAEVNPVLAGYFARTAASLLTKRPTEITEYLRRRGGERLFKSFLDRLHMRSLAELFARLLCAERQADLLFPVEDLVARLLARLKGSLEGAGAFMDIQENAPLIIIELLGQKDSLCYGNELMLQLTAPSAVALLMDLMESKVPGSVSAATSILGSVVFHTNSTLKGVTVGPASTPTMSPLTAPALGLMGEEDVVNVGVTLGEAALEEAAHWPAGQSGSPAPKGSPEVEHRRTEPGPWLETRNSDLIRELSGHFPRLRELLRGTNTEDVKLTMPQGGIRPVGHVTLEVVSLVSTLARTGSAAVIEGLITAKLVTGCMEAFLRHPWSSMLHNSVRMLMTEVLQCQEPLRVDLVADFLCGEDKLAERIAAEFQAETAALESGDPKRRGRTGFMGPLELICLDIRDYSSRHPKIAAALDAVSGWNDAVLPVMDRSQAVQAEQLGGGVPAEDRGLASASTSSTLAVSQSASLDVANAMEPEFFLDDLHQFEIEDNWVASFDEAPVSALHSHGAKDSDLDWPAPPSSPPPAPTSAFQAHFDDDEGADVAAEHDEGVDARHFQVPAKLPGSGASAEPVPLPWPADFEAFSSAPSASVTHSAAHSPPSANSSDVGVGVENLFALLGESLGGLGAKKEEAALMGGFQGWVDPVPSTFPPAPSLPPPAPVWTPANFWTAAPAAVNSGGMPPATPPLQPASQGPPISSDRSWIADFDPLAQ